MDEALQRWLLKYPYLEKIARFQGVVEEAAHGAATVSPLPAWDPFEDDYRRKVALLHSTAIRLPIVDFAAPVLGRIVERVSASPLPQKLAGACQELQTRFSSSRQEIVRALEWVAGTGIENEAPAHSGLIQYLGWTALSQVLAPVVESFGQWRDEDAWGQGYCPTCGAFPVMGQLVPSTTGRLRSLSCSCCRSRWRAKRIGCPYCGNEDSNRLSILQVEEGEPMRIDVCESCKGYVKTYTGQGEEKLFLADWTTLHLDVLARERGFERKGISLYELETPVTP